MKQKRVKAKAHRFAKHLVLSSCVMEHLEQRQMLAAHVTGSSVVYNTIQAAINAAPVGGTVTVDAGTYPGDVVINKTLTVNGAEAGVDPRGNYRKQYGTESIVTGALLTTGLYSAGFTITANDVVVNGFTVQGETNTDLSAGAGIVISPKMSGTHILNNIVQNNVSGLFLANYSSTDQAVIQHNIFLDNNNPGENGGRGIYTDQTESGGNLTDVLIDGNCFIGNHGSSGTTYLEAGIAFEASSANEQSNITITNNVFDSDGKAMLFFNSTNVTIQNNIATNGLDWYSGSVRFEGNNHNVTITQNLLYDNTGPAIAVDSKGVPGDSSGFVVTYNDIYGNGVISSQHMGVVFDGNNYDGTFDERYNYWGNSSGPSGDGPGAGDSVYGIGHTVSGQAWNVSTGGSELYSPWSSTPIGAIDFPYWDIAATDGANIQAEDFNHGGQGIAYNAVTATNAGGQYRSTGVDIETTSDTGSGYDVTGITAGEYLDFGVSISQTGSYDMNFRLASSAAGANFHVNVDGTNVTGPIVVPNTGGSQVWQTVSVTGLSLTAGVHTLRIVFDTVNTAGKGPSFNWFELSNTGSLTGLTAPTGVIATSGTTSIVLSWAAVAGAASYDIYRGTTSGGEASTPYITGVTGTSYTDSSLAAGTSSYYYYVTAFNGNSIQSNGQSPASVEVTGTNDIVKLTGTPIGTTTSWLNNGDTIAQVFDGSFSTYFDAANNSLGNWVGLNLGSPQMMTTIKYVPRAGYEFRMVGGQFQASSTPDFSSNVVTLYTVTTAPVAGQFTTVSVNPGGAYQYVRYVGGTQWVNIAEMEVDGIYAAPPATQKISGAPIGTQTSWLNIGDTIAQVFDGNFDTYFDAPNGNLTNWVGLDMGVPQTIQQIKFAPRAGYEFRMVGGQFQVSSTPDFSSNVVTLYTITTAPIAGQFTTVYVSPGAAYRYVRYVGGTQWVNIAEMEVDGLYTAPPAPVKLTGTVIGTPTSWLNNGDTIAQVFDGSFNTYFDAANNSLTNWVGLNLGTPETITQIKYSPRAGYEFRMVGGEFQVSTTPDFSSNVLTVYTISTAPVAGQWTTVAVSVPSAYQYVRYVGGSQWVNIAEMEVDGFST